MNSITPGRHLSDHFSVDPSSSFDYDFVVMRCISVHWKCGLLFRAVLL